MPYQVLNVPDRLAIDSHNHIANRKPGFARFAASGTITRNYSSFDWNFSGVNVIRSHNINCSLADWPEERRVESAFR